MSAVRHHSGGVHFGWRSLLHYWRSSLAVIAAVAVATAALTGALLVGSSMRQSLRGLALDRLGNVEGLLVSRGFFRAGLADDLRATPGFETHFGGAAAAILLPSASAESAAATNGLATGAAGLQRATGIAIWGIDASFTELAPSGQARWPVPGEDETVLTRPLADELGISQAEVDSGQARVTLRFEKPSRLPGDSALGRKRDIGLSLVRLKVSAIVDDRGLGGIGLAISQGGSRNAFVSLGRLREELDAPAVSSLAGPDFANVILVGRPEKNGTASPDFAPVRSKLLVRAADLGIDVRPVRIGASDSASPPVAEYTSLSTAQLVFSDREAAALSEAFPAAAPVSTYLANSIRRLPAAAGSDGNTAPPSSDGNDPAVIPYSMISGIAFDDQFRPQAPDGEGLNAPADDEVILNQWAATSLGVQSGDEVIVRYFEPESTHGQSVEREVTLRVGGIAALTMPATPFVPRGRERVEPAAFTEPPTVVNDPDLTPHVPGMTDSASIDDWDVPFQMTERIRPEDDDYWSYYRTTPKAFVSVATARRLWSSRFGTITGFRIPATVPAGEVEQRVAELWRADKLDGGLSHVPLRQQHLRASSGTTPFDALFLGLSLFLIAAALLLVALLFRLGLEERAKQLGSFAALGFSPRRIARLWLGESFWLATIGAVLGAGLGTAWAALMVHGLTTWWVAAIGRPFLRLNVEPLWLVAGAGLGMAAALVTVARTIRRLSRQPAVQLLNGQTETPQSTNRFSATHPNQRGLNEPVPNEPEASATGSPSPTSSPRPTLLAWWPHALLVLALAALTAGQSLGGENQAAAFVGGGMALLLGLLGLLGSWLKAAAAERKSGVSLSPSRLAFSNLVRNPSRSVLTAGLVAVAAFLVVAINAFRLAPSDQSTGGIDAVARTAQPVFDDLNSPAGKEKLLGSGKTLSAGSQVYAFRVQPGEDASCNNIYQSVRPEVLGVPDTWIARFDDQSGPAMRWSASSAQTKVERANPWRVLRRSQISNFESQISNPESRISSLKSQIPDSGFEISNLKSQISNLEAEIADGSAAGELAPDGSPIVDAVLDKNTAWYSLKLYTVGSLFPVEFDSGERVTFRVAGLLENSLLQGSLLVSEADFERCFPAVSGYRYFLIDAGGNGDGDIGLLEQALGDQGFDAQPATALLERFMSVQNTYLSAFQALGGLGLLLGTAGLAAVMLRNILQRRGELAVMRCVGFSPGRLAGIVLLEQMLLLAIGLGVGLVAALASVFPHWLAGGASLPWQGIALIVLGVGGIGLLTGLLVAFRVVRLPVIPSLRSG